MTSREGLALDRLAHLRARLQTLPPLLDMLRTDELEQLLAETGTFVGQVHAEMQRRGAALSADVNTAQIRSEPRLSVGVLYDTLTAICAENGKTLDDLAPRVFTEALVNLGRLAKEVAAS